MISKFRKFIDKESLFDEDDKILLACSGGIDSMVLADLLLVDKWKFGIAHINHQTRGEASDGDLLFVEDFCKQNGISFHGVSMPIEQMAQDAKENFQAYARRFRYDYLSNVSMEYNYQFIATGHHKSDSLESFFINLTRGTGLDGLTGIPLKHGKIIRPLMFASKKEIDAYATKFKIAYREDASNESIKYTRNYIRHELIPKLEGISDAAVSNSKATISKLRTTKILLDELISANKFINEIDDEIQIAKSAILSYKESSTLLFYLINPFGYNFDQATQIIKSINSIGSMFYAGNQELLVDRTNLIVKKSATTKSKSIFISEQGTYTLNDGRMIEITKEKSFEINEDKKTEFVDSAKIEFPIEIRTWKDGDKFSPLGMNGKQKKVKDFLTDLKLNRFEKNNQLVMLSKDEIVWVVGRRASDKFKCSEPTKNIFRLSVSE